MNISRTIQTVVVISLVFLLSTFPFIQNQVSATGDVTRTGAWVDSITLLAGEGGIDRIKDGTIDIDSHAYLPTTFENIQSDPSIDHATANGTTYELSLNPAVFTDPTQLNPFSVAKIREALNWLVDRNYLNQITYSGLALEKLFPITTGFPDYVRYSNKVLELESYYAYNPSLAENIINSEMLTLGAVKTDGIWQFNDLPVVIKFIIRNDSDGLRIPMGNYMADQLESIGFTTERHYLSSNDAREYWLFDDPAEGTWHIYTGGWNFNVIDRDQGDIFQLFESPDSSMGSFLLWQAYNPSTEYREIMTKLASNDYSSWEERATLFEDALEMSMKFAVRIWLLDGKGVNIRRATTTISNDLAAGTNSALWPFTVRFWDSEGGNLNIGAADVFVDAWNPIAGSDWAFDMFPIRATSDYGLLSHPVTGLNMLQRVASAQVTAVTSSVVQVTENWVSLDFASEIQIPADTWVDWDAYTEQFITAGIQYPEGLTANLKSVVTYPVDLFSTITWHDGSPLTMGDFIMAIIIGADRSKIESPIYDSNASSIFDDVLGIRITNTNPLTIETYSNAVALDAEANVYPWWPSGNTGPSPWHTTALAVYVEVGNALAFSDEKATDLGVPWTNYLYGDSLSILSDNLVNISEGDYIPYLPTMGNYVTTVEASQRWSNLTNWYSTEGHFWVGSGPFYLDDYSWDNKTLTLTRFEAFPDLATKWEMFQEGSIHILALDYTEGAPGSTFTIIGQHYPSLAALDVLVNGVKVGMADADVDGRFEFTLTMPEEALGGVYLVTVVVSEGVTPLLRSSDNEVTSHTVMITLNPDGTLLVREELFTHIESTVTEPADQVFLPMITR